MVTVPATPSGQPSHQHRAIAESFGTDAGRYDRTRPRYPQAMVDRIVAASRGRDVLDVGCGTGIVARLFQAAGCHVLGVDPDPRMADFARRSGVEVEVATIETWDPGGRAFDAVVAGQTWHWVDPVVGALTAAQALRPGGRVALFWNGFQLPAELGAAIGRVYDRVLPDAPGAGQWSTLRADAYAALADRAADGLRQSGAFGVPEQWRFDWERPYTRDEWLDQLPTFGGQNLMPSSTLDKLVAGVGAAVDAAGGRFTTRYTTIVATAARADPL